ncbi:MAG: bifunctional enzyme CysN/CysC [Solirubrobacteraceae bacterium]|nr:bifunctional enzyme CysN/CysC [Solirubrobacteraceae bacterium]
MGLAAADLIRLATAGSVDDGKSTLIGRLLLDSKQVLTDQLEHVEEASRRRGAGMVDLSLLVDGLRAEREQGITIDVAYRYFATARRTFIIADTPGHVQYTRNMVTGASTADLAVILVDARKGVLEQSKRHAYISSLLGIPHMAVCVNKMDLVDFDEEVFDTIVREFSGFAGGLKIRDIAYLPISARYGDNVVDRSEHMPWYGGVPLLEHLESVQVADDRNLDDVRFPVQWVIRDHESDYRGYAGQVAGGILRPGDEIQVLPSGERTRITRIDTFDGPVNEAFAPMSVTLVLDDEIDISRGDLLCGIDDAPSLERSVEATVCWMTDEPLRGGARYAIKHATHAARAIVDEVVDRVDVHTLTPDGAVGELGLNDIGRVRLRTSKPLAFDPYERNRATGSFILIDETTNDTVGAGMIC